MSCCEPHCKAKKKGFTLIELLVVIAIIAILAAILFPVFAQAKAAAQKAVCLSSNKQIDLAAIMYAGDNDDTYPFSSNLVQDNLGYDFQTWFCQMWYDNGFNGPFYDVKGGLLYPYEKNTLVQSCPIGKTQLNSVLPLELPSGLGMNTELFPNEMVPWGGQFYPVVNCTSVDDPAQTLVVADSANPQEVFGGGVGYVTPEVWLEGPGQGPANTWGVHGHLANAGWADGHTKAMQVTLRPVATTYPPDMAIYQKYWLGDFINPKYPFGSQWQDFYYNPSKPTQ